MNEKETSWNELPKYLLMPYCSVNEFVYPRGRICPDRENPSYGHVIEVSAIYGSAGVLIDCAYRIDWVFDEGIETMLASRFQIGERIDIGRENCTNSN